MLLDGTVSSDEADLENKRRKERSTLYEQRIEKFPRDLRPV